MRAAIPSLLTLAVCAACAAGSGPAASGAIDPGHLGGELDAGSATAPAPALALAPAPAGDAPPVGPAATAGSAPSPITLAFAGDVMFGRFVPDGFAPIEAERHDPFAKVAHLLGAADLAIVNLETPVMARPPARSAWGTRMRFVATPARLATLATAGVDVVSLANNHHYDMRAGGVAETPGHCAATGLTAIGAARDAPAVRVETLTVRGRRLAAIAITAVRNGPQRASQPLLPHAEPRDLAATVAPLVTAARADHDLVMVIVHWGVEYADAPSRWQRDAAHAAVDAGADLVIGHHPHVLQGIERYRGALIAYSLGNFLFDNTRPIERQTGVLTVDVDARGCTAARFDPALLHKLPEHHVAAAPGRRGRAVRERVRQLSAARPLATTWRDDGEALHLERACRAP